MVSKALIEELRAIFREDYLVELTQEEGFGIANLLTGYFRCLIKIDKNKQLKVNENDNAKSKTT